MKKTLLLPCAVALCLAACSPKINTDGWKEKEAQGYELECPPEAMIFQANDEGEILFQISMKGMNTLIAAHDHVGGLENLAAKVVEELPTQFDNVRVQSNEAMKLSGRNGQGISYMVDYKNGGGNAAAADWRVFSFLFQEDGKFFEYRFMGKGDSYDAELQRSKDIFSTFEKED
jgi:hypothetical protein